MTGGVAWARLVFTTADGHHLQMEFHGLDVPTLADVEFLAVLQMAARRVSGRIRLEEVAAPLKDLLDLAGLVREVGGQVERREEGFGFQEGVDPDDQSV